MTMTMQHEAFMKLLHLQILRLSERTCAHSLLPPPMMQSWHDESQHHEALKMEQRHLSGLHSCHTKLEATRICWELETH